MVDKFNKRVFKGVNPSKNNACEKVKGLLFLFPTEIDTVQNRILFELKVHHDCQILQFYLDPKQ